MHGWFKSVQVDDPDLRLNTLYKLVVLQTVQCAVATLKLFKTKTEGTYICRYIIY